MDDERKKRMSDFIKEQMRLSYIEGKRKGYLEASEDLRILEKLPSIIKKLSSLTNDNKVKKGQ